MENIETGEGYRELEGGQASIQNRYICVLPVRVIDLSPFHGRHKVFSPPSPKF